MPRSYQVAVSDGRQGNGEPSWSSAKERRRLVQLFRDEVVEIPMGVRDQDFRGAGLETSFDCRVPFLGHQASTLLVRLASLGGIRLDLPDDTADSLHVDGDEGLHFLRQRTE